MKRLIAGLLFLPTVALGFHFSDVEKMRGHSTVELLDKFGVPDRQLTVGTSTYYSYDLCKGGAPQSRFTVPTGGGESYTWGSDAKQTCREAEFVIQGSSVTKATLKRNGRR